MISIKYSDIVSRLVHARLTPIREYDGGKIKLIHYKDLDVKSMEYMIAVNENDEVVAGFAGTAFTDDAEVSEFISCIEETAQEANFGENYNELNCQSVPHSCGCKTPS